MADVPHWFDSKEQQEGTLSALKSELGRIRAANPSDRRIKEIEEQIKVNGGEAAAAKKPAAKAKE